MSSADEAASTTDEETANHTDEPADAADEETANPSDAQPIDEYHVTGHYAGPLSRLLAALIDWFGALTGYGLLGAVTVFFLNLLTGGDRTTGDIHTLSAWVLFGLWMFSWYWIGYATTGKTVGNLVIGIRVVADDGTALSAGRSAVRVLVLPFSVMLAGIGLIGIVLGRRHSGFHDVAARSAVVYDWGTRPAERPKMRLVS